MDTQYFGGYNIIPSPRFAAGHKNVNQNKTIHVTLSTVWKHITWLMVLSRPVQENMGGMINIKVSDNGTQ